MKQLWTIQSQVISKKKTNKKDLVITFNRVLNYLIPLQVVKLNGPKWACMYSSYYFASLLAQHYYPAVTESDKKMLCKNWNMLVFCKQILGQSQG